MVDVRTVTFTLDLRPAFVPIREAGKNLRAALTYTTADPMVFRLAFLRADGTETAAYEFPRETLADGLHKAAGDAAVRCGPSRFNPDRVAITITQDDAYPFTVLVDRERATEFVELSCLLCPEGAEWDQFDAALVELLNGTDQ